MEVSHGDRPALGVVTPCLDHTAPQGCPHTWRRRGLLGLQGTRAVTEGSFRKRNRHGNARSEKKARSKVGPPGAIGPTGPAGSVAGSGPIGPTGPAGPAGPISLTGATGATGSAGICGWEVVTTTPSPLAEFATAIAMCPGGKRVLGGGYQFVSWNSGFIGLVTSNTALLGDRWYVTVENVGTPGSGVQIVVTAICANVM